MLDMNSQPLVSVLVPAYNVELYLSYCLNSILNQSYTNLEIVIVDDGSTDDTPLICDTYAKEDKRVKVIHQKNQGLAETRNVLINKSSGEYITFVDSDDYVDSEYVSQLLLMINQYDADISVCGRCLFYEDGTEEAVSNPGFQNERMSSERALLAMNSCTSFDMAAWGKLYSRKVFDNVEYPRNRLSEDGYTAFKLLCNARAVIYKDVPLYYYFQRKGSITNSSSLNFDHARAADVQAEYLFDKWPEGRNVCTGYCLLARMYLYGIATKRSIQLNKNESAFLLGGNTQRMRALWSVRAVPLHKKMQASLFALCPSLYAFLFRLAKKFCR